MAIQEKCKTDVMKNYVREKFETQRESFRETRAILSRQLQHKEKLLELSNKMGGLRKNFVAVIIMFGLMTGVPKRKIAFFDTEYM